jgi:NAD(P)-dependent dehydrogenase (short-subunit alcohol dehydrogenase family)
MKDSNLLLKGQVAIVTGAGRGVGRAIAEALAAAGAAVAVAARSAHEIDEVAAAIGAAGGRAEALCTDVTDGIAVDALVHETSNRLGPPTLLVNNAGTWRHVGPLATANPDDWWEDIEVSLKGAFLCTRAVLPDMLERGSGRIVNVTSYAGTEPRPHATAYAAGKAALLRLTDSLAAELDGQGVLTFAITPGFVRTRLVEDVASSGPGRTYLPELKLREDALDPERAAQLVVEIASGRLDPLAGRLLHVLDDFDALLLHSEEINAGDLYTLRLRTLPPSAQ